MGAPGDDGEVPSVRISSTSASVTVVAEARHDVAVAGSAQVRTEGSLTTVDAVRSRLVVRVPAGADVVVGTTSGRVEVGGPAGHVAVVTQSGRIEVEEATSVDARTASGRVVIGVVAGDCRIRSESGLVEVAACGDADVATTNGRIHLERACGPVRAHSVSGRIAIELASAQDVDAETVSGRVTVSLPPGVAADQPSAPTEAARPAGGDCQVNARSVSGRVVVTTR